MSETNELNVMRDLVDTLKTKAKERGVKKFPTIQRSNVSRRVFLWSMYILQLIRTSLAQVT